MASNGKHTNTQNAYDKWIKEFSGKKTVNKMLNSMESTRLSIVHEYAENVEGTFPFLCLTLFTRKSYFFSSLLCMK